MIRLHVVFVSHSPPQPPGAEPVIVNRQMEVPAYLAVDRIDTVTPVAPGAFEAFVTQFPTRSVRAIVKYDDRVVGYRYYYVRETADQVFEKVDAWMRGGPDVGGDEDGDEGLHGTPDFLPQGI